MDIIVDHKTNNLFHSNPFPNHLNQGDIVFMMVCPFVCICLFVYLFAYQDYTNTTGWIFLEKKLKMDLGPNEIPLNSASNLDQPWIQKYNPNFPIYSILCALVEVCTLWVLLLRIIHIALMM